MLSLRRALNAEPEFLSSTSMATGSPSKSISVSSFDKESVMFNEISAIHCDIVLLSGLWASQDNKFNFIVVVYKRPLNKGKSKKLVLIAVANKLLKQCFAIAKSGRPHDETYVSILPK